MKPKFNQGDVVFLCEDKSNEFRKKYKIIEIYVGEVLGEMPENASLDYLVQPLTDGIERIVEEGEIERLAE